jgi:hypothetical protein
MATANMTKRMFGTMRSSRRAAVEVTNFSFQVVKVVVVALVMVVSVAIVVAVVMVIVMARRMTMVVLVVVMMGRWSLERCQKIKVKKLFLMER